MHTSRVIPYLATRWQDMTDPVEADRGDSPVGTAVITAILVAGAVVVAGAIVASPTAGSLSSRPSRDAAAATGRPVGAAGPAGGAKTVAVHRWSSPLSPCR